MSKALIHKYYESFNQKNWDQFLGMLDQNVVHEINHGDKEIGINKFKKFLDRMNNCYEEKISDITIYSCDRSNLYATQYTVTGTYLKTDEGLPPAKGQTYELKGAAFFEVEENKITLVTNYYNLKEWLDLIHSQSK
ncbi:MAG: nuclear transport factor 2 family protein [Bacteriovoracaceae bacterium]